MAVGHGANDHETVIGKWELLLSVSVPGRIPWDQIGSVSNFVSSLASLAQAPGPASPIASVAPGQPAEDPGASDPLDDLRRLGSLRDAGILTEAEFAVEKARVLDRI